MKKFILIFCFLISKTIFGQEIAYKDETETYVSFLTTTQPLQFEPNLCSVSSAALIPSDTAISVVYMLFFYYNTPKTIMLDSSCTVELMFSDETTYRFNYVVRKEEMIPQDSSVTFNTIVNYECMYKLTKMPIKNISFITPLYRHQIVIEDRMKLFLPNLARFVLDKSDQVFQNNLNFERSIHVPSISFDVRGNKILDKRYFGKYSGEWYRDSFLYNFDLYITSDTSYIVWYILKDSYEINPKRIKTQLLNIRELSENKTLIMDVCFDSTKEDYTSGRRTFYLKLSENGNVMYGSSLEFGIHEAHMFAIRKKKYLK